MLFSHLYGGVVVVVFFPECEANSYCISMVIIPSSREKDLIVGRRFEGLSFSVVAPWFASRAI